LDVRRRPDVLGRARRIDLYVACRRNPVHHQKGAQTEYGDQAERGGIKLAGIHAYIVEV
jgi:hypothetical protein